MADGERPLAARGGGDSRPERAGRPRGDAPADGRELEQAVVKRVLRRLRAERESRRSIWFGLGMLGLVGWSIALPALLGVSCGRYLDAHYPRSYSWTLALLLAGVAVGCANAWYWVQQERGRG